MSIGVEMPSLDARRDRMGCFVSPLLIIKGRWEISCGSGYCLVVEALQIGALQVEARQVDHFWTYFGRLKHFISKHFRQTTSGSPSGA